MNFLFHIRNNTSIADPPEVVKDGDIIELVHGMTSRLLNRSVGFTVLNDNRMVADNSSHVRIIFTFSSNVKYNISLQSLFFA